MSPSSSHCNASRSPDMPDGIPHHGDDSNSVPVTYSYTPLPKDSIHLLRLLPDKNRSSPVKCRLSTCAFLKTGRSHPYEALSYVWGSEAYRKVIVLDDKDIEIGSSLYDALIHLRDDFFERVLWVDALCIKQQDNFEKGVQVQAMALIYAKATRVVVWLGMDEGNGEQALEELRFAATRTQVNREFTHNPSPSVLHLVKRPWFERV
ncbi:heterokaryon incompatibility protein-domain-containing protein [Podospora aff. communis PSN243]|uniref:Heterokaryon incompatibility protein-domain-containing protein n=1 Tax=Podospora aff. communis PSN243 TaxID=3040156 RepID=A0AAV9GUI4_9PEZI|nr:heterokaryon incompatibility protein-domain-containing protein [Podospora aff. communis PSN243]